MSALVQHKSDRRVVAPVAAATLTMLFTYLVIQFYLWCLATDPPDFAEFLIPWYREIMREGRLSVFAEPFSNYSPPYLYLLSVASLADGFATPAAIIRGLSVAIMAMLATVAYRFVRRSGYAQPYCAAIAAGLLVLPSLVINAVMLGQCDPLWVAPCLLAVLAATQRKPARMAIWCGIAFAVKAQAVFIAPFALGVMIALRPKWWVWTLPVIAFAACLLPAVIMGWPVPSLLTIYLGQTQHFAGLVSVGGPNPWLLIDYADWHNATRDMPIAYASAAVGALGVSWLTWRAFAIGSPLSTVIILALLSALILPFALPMMHARYFLLADILAILLWAVDRSLRNLAIAIATQIGSVGGLMAYISSEAVWYLGNEIGFTHAAAPLPVFGIAGVAAMTIAVALTTHSVWQRVFTGQLPSR